MKTKKTKWYDVIITLNDGSQFIDGIRGENEEDALKNAYWNWEAAEEIELVETGR